MAWKLTSGLGLLLVALADGVGQGRDAPVGVRELLGTGHLRATDSLAVGGREGAVTLTTDLTDLRQVVRNFGASDAWCAQYVGTRDWPLARREQVADWLFSTGFDAEGRPRGIGLSLWRFNLGSGSSRRTSVSDPWRRADSFEVGRGRYDWSRCAGQRWFLQAARKRGVGQFVAFVNSPPVRLTRNGKAFADRGTSCNLRDGAEGEFAVYLADVLAHFKGHEGVTFDYVSPFNEPNWKWDGRGQEGCPYRIADIHRVVAALHTALARRKLTTKILVPEAGSVGSLLGGRRERENYLSALFHPSSRHYVARLVAPVVAAHSYHSDHPPAKLIERRRQLRTRLRQYGGLEYWMTEYCLLINSPQIRGGGRDLGITPALWLARMIHADLTIAEAAAWQWWLAISKYNYKDGLVYVDADSKAIHASKMLWAMGNFSRFIHPGTRRVGLKRSDGLSEVEAATDLIASAYHDRARKAVIVVLINWTDKPKAVKLAYKPPGPAVAGPIYPFVTSAVQTDNLAPYRAQPPGEAIQIPPRSVVTLVTASQR